MLTLIRTQRANRIKATQLKNNAVLVALALTMSGLITVSAEAREPRNFEEAVRWCENGNVDQIIAGCRETIRYTQTHFGEFQQPEHAAKNLVVAHIALARVYAGRENYRLAIDNMSNAIPFLLQAEVGRAERAKVLDERGRYYEDSGQYQRAIQDHTEAIHLDPNNASAYNNRGVSHERLEQYRQAIEDFTEAIRLDPNDANTYDNRGIAYRHLEQYRQAIEDFTEAIRLSPKEANSYENRGVAYQHLEQYRHAIRDYTDAIRLRPNNEGAYAYRALSHSRLGQHHQAIADYTEIVGLNPQDAWAYNRRGNVHARLGQYQQAIEDNKRAVHLEPESEDTRNSLAWTYYLAGRNSEALPEARNAVGLDDTKAEIIDTLAHILTDMGQTEEGYQEFLRSAQVGGRERIIEIQEALKERGYYRGSVDGIMGQSTRSALLACVTARCRLLDPHDTSTRADRETSTSADHASPQIAGDIPAGDACLGLKTRLVRASRGAASPQQTETMARLRAALASNNCP